MKKLIVYHGDSPVYVEGFSKDCKRSRDGSVHIIPGKPLTVTDDEFDFIKSKYSWMKVKVIAEVKEKKSEEKGGKVEAKETKKVEAKAETKETKAEAKPQPKTQGEKPDKSEKDKGTKLKR